MLGGGGGGSGGGGSGGGGGGGKDDDPDKLTFMMGTTDPFRICANSWSSLMEYVSMSVNRLPGNSQLGYIRTEVSDPAKTCISATVIEARVEHLGSAMAGKAAVVLTKNLALALKLLSGSGDLCMSLAKGEPYRATSTSTHSETAFEIPIMESVGAASVIPQDQPAEIEHVVNLDANELRSFMTGLAAMGSEYFNVRVQSDGQRVALTIQGESSSSVSMNGKRTFFGSAAPYDPVAVAAAAAAASTSSTLAVAGSGLRSAHILKLDERKLEQPVCVGDSDNASAEEISQALAALQDAEKVVDTTSTFMLRFALAFLSKLDVRSKFIMAIVRPTGGDKCLFFRSSTPKSVMEIMLSGANVD
jgi:hypothetical protein